MTAPNGKRAAEARVWCLAVPLPAEIRAPRFVVHGVWFTDAGIQVPPQQLSAGPLAPAVVCDLFLQLAASGQVQYALTDEKGEKTVHRFPGLELVVVPTPPAQEQPQQRIIAP